MLFIFTLSLSFIFGLQKRHYLDWFGSTYYLKLYRNRSYEEAQLFIDKLLQYLDPAKNARFIDVCCGRGRHSIYLNSKGFSVVGVDNAHDSIKAASAHANDKLQFFERDIREDFSLGKFNFALNLFTSFGYFNADEESLISLSNISNCIQSEGSFVFDYLNEKKVVSNLSETEQQEIDGIKFSITRTVDDRFIRKHIKVVDGNEEYQFQEQVRRFGIKELKPMLESVGFEIKNIFGNYTLDAFDENVSDRLIIHAIKS